MDDFNGVCGDGKYPLLSTITRVLKPYEGLAKVAPAETKPKMTSKPVATLGPSSVSTRRPAAEISRKVSKYWHVCAMCLRQKQKERNSNKREMLMAPVSPLVANAFFFFFLVVVFCLLVVLVLLFVIVVGVWGFLLLLLGLFCFVLFLRKGRGGGGGVGDISV